MRTLWHYYYTDNGIETCKIGWRDGGSKAAHPGLLPTPATSCNASYSRRAGLQHGRRQKAEGRMKQGNRATGQQQANTRKNVPALHMRGPPTIRDMLQRPHCSVRVQSDQCTHTAASFLQELKQSFAREQQKEKERIECKRLLERMCRVRTIA